MSVTSIAFEEVEDIRFQKEYSAKWPTSFTNQYVTIVKRYVCLLLMVAVSRGCLRYGAS